MGEYKYGEAWKHRNDRYWISKYNTREQYLPRKAKFEPQFTVEQFWRNPLKAKRRYATDGERTWVEWDPLPVKEPLKTGIKIFDEWVDYVAEGHSNSKKFCERYGLETSDINSMVFILTGHSTTSFAMAYKLLTLDVLLRYTDLSCKELARQTGIGSTNNLFIMSKTAWGVAPITRRKAIQKPGDVGRYKFQ